MDFVCHFHLCFSLPDSGLYNVVFPFRQMAQCVFLRRDVRPSWIPCFFFVTDLIHDIQRIPRLRVNRFIQGDRTLDGISANTMSFGGTSIIFEISSKVGSVSCFFHQCLFGINSFVGSVTERERLTRIALLSRR